MADFSTPFAASAVTRRFPTDTEATLGFPCGEADQDLFNGMFHRIEAEIGDVIESAGLTPTDSDLTQLTQAIQALIDAATGGGSTSQFLLLSQASSRLPIHAETASADGKINVSSPAAGTVRLPGGVTILHRGISPVVTTQTDFSTSGSKTYHLRWSKTGGFELKDLASGSYNPGTLPETDASFDSTYDDVLLARVVTNSSNIATITNLVNKSDLQSTLYVAGINGTNVGKNFSAFDFAFPLDWSRTPKATGMTVFSRSYNANQTDDGDIAVRAYGNSSGPGLSARPVTRYSSRFNMMWDGSNGITLEGVFGA